MSTKPIEALRTTMLALAIAAGGTAAAQDTAPATGASGATADGAAVATPGAAPASDTGATRPAGPSGPPPLPAGLAVYVDDNGTAAGPFTAAELRARIAAGTLTRNTLTWMDGMADWAPAAEIPEVAALFPAGPPPLRRTGEDVGRTAPQDDAAQTQQQAGIDPEQFIVGTWQYGPEQVPIPGFGMGTADGTVVYNADKTMTFYGTMRGEVQGQAVTIRMTGDGTYKVQRLGPDRFSVTPDAMVTSAIPGFPSSTSEFNTPTVLTVIDQQTVRSDEGTVSRRVDP